MKVGDVIQDYQFPTDRGIILAVVPGKLCEYWVLAFECGFASWLPEKYMKKCKVINEGADND